MFPPCSIWFPIRIHPFFPSRCRLAIAHAAGQPRPPRIFRPEVAFRQRHRGESLEPRWLWWLHLMSAVDPEKIWGKWWNTLTWLMKMWIYRSRVLGFCGLQLNHWYWRLSICAVCRIHEPIHNWGANRPLGMFVFNHSIEYGETNARTLGRKCLACILLAWFQKVHYETTNPSFTAI